MLKYKCKIFNYSIAFIEKKINEWLNENSIEIKHVSQTYDEHYQQVAVTIFYTDF